MKVRELNREQLVELKQGILFSLPECPSYGELADADNLVDDETVFDLYDDTEFEIGCAGAEFNIDDFNGFIDHLSTIIHDHIPHAYRKD